MSTMTPITEYSPRMEGELNVDVSALFGEQAVKELEENLKIRRGTRTKPRKSSMTHSKSFKYLFNPHTQMSPEQVAQFEEGLMKRAEFEQTFVDRFWGLDKEAADSAREQKLMSIEDELSTSHEYHCNMTAQHRIWLQQEEKTRQEQNERLREDEKFAQMNYMQIFHSVNSSGDIMHFRWPTDKHGAQYSTSKTGYEINTSATDSSTVHIDGHQQSRSIIKGSSDPILGSGGHSTTLAGLARQSEQASVKSAQQSRSTLSRSKILQNKSPKVISNISIEELTKIKHIPEVDGHPTHKWDQITALKQAFQELDYASTGEISRQDIYLISQNVTIQSLLRHTVFWSIVKRRQWSFFYSIFHDNSDTITVFDWLNAAIVLAHECLPLSKLRSDEEHMSVAAGHGVWSDLLGLGQKSNYSHMQRDVIHQNNRQAYLRRLLAPQDLVWALHNNGCVWLPAVIEKYHGDKFNVRYLLTQEEVQSARNFTSTRQYVVSSQPAPEDVLSPKAFKTEAEVCEYVFNLLDVNKQQKLDIQQLVSQLREEKYKSIIASSASLQLLFCDEYDIKSMVQDMFSDGCVTKDEFVELGCAIADIKCYDYATRFL